MLRFQVVPTNITSENSMLQTLRTLYPGATDAQLLTAITRLEGPTPMGLLAELLRNRVAHGIDMYVEKEPIAGDLLVVQSRALVVSASMFSSWQLSLMDSISEWMINRHPFKALEVLLHVPLQNVENIFRRTFMLVHHQATHTVQIRGRMYLKWFNRATHHAAVGLLLQALIEYLHRAPDRIPGLFSIMSHHPAAINVDVCCPPAPLVLPLECDLDFWRMFDYRPYLAPFPRPFNMIHGFSDSSDPSHFLHIREKHSVLQCLTYPLETPLQPHIPFSFLCPFSTMYQTPPAQVCPMGGILYDLKNYRTCFLSHMLPFMKNQSTEHQLIIVPWTEFNRVKRLWTEAGLPLGNMIWDSKDMRDRKPWAPGIRVTHYGLIKRCSKLRRWLQDTTFHRILVDDSWAAALLLLRIPWKSQNLWFTFHQLDKDRIHKILPLFAPSGMDVKPVLDAMFRILAFHHPAQTNETSYATEEVIIEPSDQLQRMLEDHKVRMVAMQGVEDQHWALTYMLDVLKLLTRFDAGIGHEADLVTYRRIMHQHIAASGFPLLETITDSEERKLDSNCPICMEEPQQPIRNTNCTHVFCYDCLELAVLRKNNCPMCRTLFSANYLQIVKEPSTKRQRVSEGWSYQSRLDRLSQLIPSDHKTVIFSHYIQAIDAMRGAWSTTRNMVVMPTEVPFKDRLLWLNRTASASLVVSHVSNMLFLAGDETFHTVILADHIAKWDSLDHLFIRFHHAQKRQVLRASPISANMISATREHFRLYPFFENRIGLL
jgi:hypothetical protein